MEKKVKKLKKVLIPFIVILLLLATGCSSDNNKSKDNNGAKTSKELVKFKIGTMPATDKIPMIVAQEKGFFKKHGVDVEVVNFKNAVDRDSALQAGELDGLVTDFVAYTTYLAAGMELTMTSDVQSNFVVLASPKSGIKTFDDIKPTHKNGIITSSVITYISNKAGKSNIILLPDVMARVEQVVNGKIDLTIVPEPVASMAIQKGAVKVGTNQDLGVQCVGLAFTNKTIKENPDAIKAFYKGYEDAIQYMASANSDEYIDTVVEKGEFSPDSAKAIAAMKFDSLKAPDKQEFEDVLAWMNKNKDFKGPFNYTFEDVTNLSFLP